MWRRLPTASAVQRQQSARRDESNFLFSFGFNGTKEQIYKLIRSVNLFSFQANLGDARSLIVNVIDTTHGELDAEELERAGIPEETIRLSIGLEDADDLIQDLKQAFEKALNLKPI